MVTKFQKFKNLGDKALKNGEYQEALKYYDRAVYLDRNNTVAWTKKAAAEIYLQKFDAALKSLDEAINLDKKNADAWFNRGIIFDRRRKYEDALEYYNRALRYEPRHVKALNNKGTVLGQLERWDEAGKCFEEVLRIDPKNEDAKENLKLLSDYRAGKHKRRCFIATAAYGTPLAPEISILRNWRDTKLSQTTSGQNIIFVYYKISPNIAKIISRNKTLRTIVRAALGPLLLFLSRSSKKLDL